MTAVMKETLVLITACRDGESVSEDAFLAPELHMLENQFGRVIRLAMSDRPAAYARMRASADPVALRAMRGSRPDIGSRWRANAYGAYSVVWRDRIERMIRSGMIDPSDTLFYTFWFDFATTGLALLADRYDITAVSRAHGYDIREERSPWLRELTLDRIAGLYAACDASAGSLRARWPGYASRIHTARLGSRAPLPMRGGMLSEDMPLTIMSCSRPVGLKRVECVARLVSFLAAECAPRRVRWIHVGGDADGLRDRCAAIASGETIEFRWAGQLSNDAVHRLYASETVHWHVLLSSAEGGVPVSVGEAMSYGIPVAATSVGGVGELVTDGVSGLLIPPDITGAASDRLLSGAASRIAAVTADRSHYMMMRGAARQAWAERYDAARLRGEFIERICQL